MTSGEPDTVDDEAMYAEFLHLHLGRAQQMIRFVVFLTSFLVVFLVVQRVGRKLWHRWSATTPRKILRSRHLEPEERAASDVLLTSTHEVKVLPIQRDGDSVFAALSHQLRRGKLRLQVWPARLRDRVCYQLYRDLDGYWDVLLEAAALHGRAFHGLPGEDAVVLRFLHHLRRPGFPGGAEVLHAVADMYQVEVMVHPEGADSHVVRCRRGRPKATLAVGRRTVADPRGALFPHFDSVLEVTWLGDPPRGQPRRTVYVRDSSAL